MLTSRWINVRGRWVKGREKTVTVRMRNATYVTHLGEAVPQVYFRAFSLAWQTPKGFLEDDVPGVVRWPCGKVTVYTGQSVGKSECLPFVVRAMLRSLREGGEGVA